MDLFRRLASSSFVKTVSHVRPPTRSFIFSKIVPVATGAAVFGMGCMMGSPAFQHTLLSGGKSPILVPLSLEASSRNKDSRTDAARSNNYETHPEPAAYGAQLAKLIAQERDEVRHLSADESKKPSSKGQLEIQRRLIRIKSLQDAVWALHMIDIAHDPIVWRLLEQNTSELNQPFTDTMSTFQKAQEAIISGETETLQMHIRECIEKNHRLGLSPKSPVSELERFMGQMPAGSAVLTRLKMLQSIATKNTEEGRLLLEDTMYWLWWVLEKKISDFARK